MCESDGTASACGRNTEGQCNIPTLDGDLTYKQVAEGQEVVEVEAGADGSPSKRDAGPEAPAHTPLSWAMDRHDGATSSCVGRYAKAFLKKILCAPC